MGISDDNFDRLASYLETLEWKGRPVGLCVDDTKLHPSLRPYHDGADNKWKLAGAHGHAPVFDTYEKLSSLLMEEENNKAEKVCTAYVLSYVIFSPLNVFRFEFGSL